MQSADRADPALQPAPSARPRDLPAGLAFDWLKAGWKDLLSRPTPSFAYGLLVFAVSILIVWGLFAVGLDFILLPALAGFMVAGPFLALGLYQKSRDIEAGNAVSLARMVRVRAESGAQVWYAGALLCLLMLGWIRAAVIIYALFFGLRALPGFDRTAWMLVTTAEGWGMLIIGTVIGGLFAAFSFAISTFAFPMMLDQRTDAFTAMGTSIVRVWNNRPVMIAWGAIVLVLFVASLATGLLGLVVIFPLLGHATWHSYKALR
jgi:uncharacterized membrane protein